MQPNQNQQAPSPMPAPMPPTGQMSPMPTPEHKIGPIVGIVIIIVLLILAALYFWSAKLNKADSTYTNTQDQVVPTPVVRNETVDPAPTAPVRTEAETKVDSDLGLDELNSLDKLDF